MTSCLVIRDLEGLSQLDARAQNDPLNLQFTLKPVYQDFANGIRSAINVVFRRGQYASSSSTTPSLATPPSTISLTSVPRQRRGDVERDPKPGTSRTIEYTETSV